MSGKQVKVTKRETRRIMRAYLEEFKEYLRPKPKWIPWFAWDWMQRCVLKMERIERKW